MPLSPVIVPPRAQASRRCETQAPLSGKPPSCAKRFGPLTPSARSGNLIAGDGTKNGLPAPNKELTANPKQPLDRKSPIQVMCEPKALDQQVLKLRDPGSLLWSSHSSVLTHSFHSCSFVANSLLRSTAGVAAVRACGSQLSAS